MEHQHSTAILLQAANHRASKQMQRANLFKKLSIALLIVVVTQIIMMGIGAMLWHEEIGLLHSQRSSRNVQVNSLKNSLELQNKEIHHLKRIIRYRQYQATKVSLPTSEEVQVALRAEADRYMNSDDSRLILVEKLEWNDEYGAKWRFKNVENGMVRVTRKRPRNGDMTIMMLDPQGKGWWHAATEFTRYPTIKIQDRKPKIEWPTPEFKILPVQSSTKAVRLEFVPKRK